MSEAKNIRIEFDANPKHFKHVPFLFEKMAFNAANLNRKAKERNGYPIADVRTKLEAELTAICTNYAANAQMMGYTIRHGYGSNHYWVSIEYAIRLDDLAEPTRLLAIYWDDK